MRVTQKLYGELRKGFWFKNIWKKKSQYRLSEASVPAALQGLGIKPVDPVEDIFHKERKQVWIPPDDPRFMFPPRLEDDPDWKPDKAPTCDETVRLWEGLRQVQLLTNTLVKDGLPDDIISRADEISSPEQDHIMQRLILQANLWDTARDKLPVRKKPDDISVWTYKTEFGIPEQRIIEILYRGITQKCAQLLALKEPDTALGRHLIENHSLNTNYKFGEERVYLTSRSNFLLTSSQPLKRFADKNEVLQTTEGKIEDIFPISPLIDLNRSNIYQAEDDVGYTGDYKYRHHHTLFLKYSKDWSIEMRHANALLMSYAHCVALAKRDSAKNTLISDPISVQTVHSDGESFGFTCFQLNTLVTSHEASSMGHATRRNMAWVDDDLLFEKIIPRRSMLRDTAYKRYNPNVLHKILGMFSR